MCYDFPEGYMCLHIFLGLVVEPSSRFLFRFSRGFYMGFIRRIIIQSELFWITFVGGALRAWTHLFFFVGPKTMT